MDIQLYAYEPLHPELDSMNTCLIYPTQMACRHQWSPMKTVMYLLHFYNHEPLRPEL
jgi:hypothetical protein